MYRKLFTILFLLAVSVYSYSADPMPEESFEGLADKAIPDGWAIQNGGDPNYYWGALVGATWAHTGTNSMRIFTFTTPGPDDWLFIKALTLRNDTTYTLRFYYEANQYGPEELYIWLGTSQNSANMTTQLWSNNNITNSNYVGDSVNFKVPSNGTYYIGFHSYNDDHGNKNTILDDIWVREHINNCPTLENGSVLPQQGLLLLCLPIQLLIKT